MAGFCGVLHRGLCTTRPGRKRGLVGSLRGSFSMAIVARGISGLRRGTKSGGIVRLRKRLSGIYSSHSPCSCQCVGRLPRSSYRIRPKARTNSNDLLQPFVIFFNRDIPVVRPTTRTIRRTSVFIVVNASLGICPTTNLVTCAGPGVPVCLVSPNTMGAGNCCGVRRVVGKTSRKVGRLGRVVGMWGLGRRTSASISSSTFVTF